MDFVQIPTEQTTSITNIVLAAVLIVIFFVLKDDKNKKRNLMWRGYMFCFFIGAVLGAIGHGVIMDKLILDILWNVLYALMGFGLGFLMIAALNDLKGGAVSRFVAGLCMVPAVLFYFVTILISGHFIVFVGYVVLTTSFALIVYAIIFARTKNLAILILIIGISFNLITGIVQALYPGELHFIWVFDGNGLSHIVYATGMALTYLGVIKTQHLFQYK
jgi:Family of unknown function (DUF6962)